MPGLASLLLLHADKAAHAVMGEACGDCGPPEVPAQDVTPEALQAAAAVAQAEAVAAAAQARLTTLVVPCWQKSCPAMCIGLPLHGLLVLWDNASPVRAVLQ